MYSSLHNRVISIGVFFLISVFTADFAWSDAFSRVKPFVGNQDAVVVADFRGRVLFSQHAENVLIPASTLKLLTALVVLEQLGTEFRFPTEFYLDNSQNLIIKGYGDPLLISEVLSDIAEKVAEHVRWVNHIVLDDHWFDPIVIPGVTDSFEPYDAPNGALCVNFNTVNFKKVNGKYISAEPQTPLLPIILPRIRKSGLRDGRIVLSSKNREHLDYAGHLFKYFFENAGIRVKGKIHFRKVNENDRMFLRYRSPFSLKQVVRNLLEFSNNFIANQTLVAAAVKSHGPPGTLNKAVDTALEYAQKHLKTQPACFVEGSGISRQNRVSAEFMLDVLEKFRPHYELLRKKDAQFYKTGSLSGIRTRVGYIEDVDNRLYPFVVLVNTPGKQTNRILSELMRVIR